MTTEREPAELSISFETGEIPARSRAVVRLDLRGAERGFVPTAVVVDEGFQFYILLATCGDEVLLQGDSPQGARVELRAVDPPDGSAVLLLVKNTGDSFRKLRGWLVGRAALSTSDQPFSISDLATRCRGWFRGGMAAALGRPPASISETVSGLRRRLRRSVGCFFVGWQNEIPDGVDVSVTMQTSLGVGPAVIEPGERKTIVVRPDFRFRPTHLSGITRPFNVVVTGSPLSRQGSRDGELDLGVVDEGQVVEVCVENPGNQQAVFQALLHGEVVLP